MQARLESPPGASPHSHAPRHAHGHAHNHAHTHAPTDFGRAFAIGASLNAGFVLFESILGFAAHSLALLADAGHNLSDVLALLLAWGASRLVKTRPAGKHTYGYRRSSILVALINAVALLLVTGGLSVEAVRQLLHPQAVAGLTVVGVAAIGIVVNLATALLFRAGSQGDLNARGAYLHMAADAAIALGVVLAGALIWTTGQTWIDPVVSLIIGGLIIAGTWGLLRDSFDLAMDAVPAGVNLAEVERHLRAYPEVAGLHHLHIWGMSTTQVALTVHLLKADATLDNAFLQRVEADLRDEFRIEHATIQLESATLPCTAPAC